MKIQFDKIGASEKPFEVVSGDIKLRGTLCKSGYHRVALKAEMRGSIALDCDRCGKAYLQNIDSDLALSLYDGVLKDKEDLDIIEFLDGMIDIAYILESEINTQRSTYHYCTTCDGSDEVLEIEY